jgi:hypothetical protein
MTADLYAGGTKYKPDDIDDSKRVAENCAPLPRGPQSRAAPLGTLRLDAWGSR